MADKEVRYRIKNTKIFQLDFCYQKSAKNSNSHTETCSGDKFDKFLYGPATLDTIFYTKFFMVILCSRIKIS